MSELDIEKIFIKNFKVMNAKFVTLESKKYAVVPFARWKKLQETIEDLQDAIKAKAI